MEFDEWRRKDPGAGWVSAGTKSDPSRGAGRSGSGRAQGRANRRPSLRCRAALSLSAAVLQVIKT